MSSMKGGRGGGKGGGGGGRRAGRSSRSPGNSGAEDMTLKTMKSLSLDKASGSKKSASENSEVEVVAHRPVTHMRSSGRVADWDHYLKLPMGLQRMDNVAPVTLFKHAPLVDIWKTFALKPRLTVETINVYIIEMFPEKVTWFARIIGFAGYMCLLEFDHLGFDEVHYIQWASFCSDLMKPMGHSSQNRIVMLPPFGVDDKPDFFKKALDRNLGRPTVGEDHLATIQKAIKRMQTYALGTIVEVVDMLNRDMSKMKLATVVGTHGARVYITYADAVEKFIFNVKSEFLHPLGWSSTVGHDCENIPRGMHLTPLEESYFPCFPIYPVNVNVEPGQYLEIRHPIKTHLIIAAKVLKILKHGYFYVVSDSLQVAADDPFQVAFHITSPYILPCGFCAYHGVDLVPPLGENPTTFSWDRYFSKYNGKPAPLHLLPRRPTPQFKLGMKLEAVDETDPKFIGPATIISIKDHLLWLHFDGWMTGKFGDEEIQAEKWIDFESPNIYPLGFCQMADILFQGCADYSPPTHPSIKYNDLAKSVAASKMVKVEQQQATSSASPTPTPQAATVSKAKGEEPTSSASPTTQAPTVSKAKGEEPTPSASPTVSKAKGEEPTPSASPTVSKAKGEEPTPSASPTVSKAKGEEPTPSASPTVSKAKGEEPTPSASSGIQIKIEPN